jgi:uncharacterized protein DUF992
MGKQMLRIGLKSALYVFAIGAALALMAKPPVAQQQYSRSGLLSCAMNPTIGLIIGSQQTMRCEFRPDRGTPEYYSGVMSRIGLDLGITAGGQMAWAVLVNAQVPMQWGLAGTYVGASGDIALGIGVGANLLIGGNNSSVALQPLSVEGQVGVNLALGIASLQLRPAR